MSANSLTSETSAKAVLRGPVVLPLMCAVALALLSLVVWAYYWPTRTGLDVTNHAIGRDFINNWAGPKLAFSGNLWTLFDLRGYHQAIRELFGQPLTFHNWGYPLFVLPIFWPLSQMPYFVALAVWTFGLFAVYAVLVLSQVPKSERFTALGLLLISPAVTINTIGGQNGFLSAALMLGGLLCLDRRPLLAGLLFGFLTFKPHLGFVLAAVLLVLGAWRTIGIAIVTAVALFAMSIALFGFDAWAAYTATVGRYQMGLLEAFQGFYTYMMVSPVAGLRMLGVPFQIAMMFQIVVSTFVIAVACVCVRRTKDAALRFLLIAAATPLATPYAFNYDLTALSAALVWCMVGRLDPDQGWSLPIVVAWLAPLLVMMPVFGSMLLPQLAFFLMLAMAAKLCIEQPLSLDLKWFAGSGRIWSVRGSKSAAHQA